MSKLKDFLNKQNNNVLLLGFLAASNSDPNLITRARGSDHLQKPFLERMKTYKYFQTSAKRVQVKMNLASCTPAPGRLR